VTTRRTRGPEPDRCSDLVEALRGLAESGQRAVRFLELSDSWSAQEVAEVLNGLARATAQRPEPLRRLHLDLVTHRELLHRIGYEKVAEIYRYATQQGWRDVQALFRAGPARARAAEPKPGGFAQRLEALTLGARKQLSRKVDRRKMEMLLFDADARVIRELLLNPKITEKDVVRLAARHQAPASVLEEVCRSERWIHGYSVKKALVFNPRTPPAYALGFGRHLRKTDLKLLLQKGGVHPDLLELARELLAVANRR
jgi:hypothetical protein